MRDTQTPQKTEIDYLPVVMDLITAVALVTAVPTLSTQLATPAGTNALLLIGIYIFFLIGVFLLRKLAPTESSVSLPAWLTFWLQPKIRAALSVLFGLGMMTGIAYQLGYFDVFMTAGPEVMDEGSSSSLFVFGPGAWLFLSMFYVFVLAFPVRPAMTGGGSGYWGAKVFGLAAINALLLLATAQIRAIMPDPSFLWLLPIYICLGMLFAPPRLLYASEQKNLYSLIAFAVLLLICAWQGAAL
ncbi:MAG: hypothetical protein KC413_09345 [Anaerolineales bacterium]|nr:hypothetical protein [Anaerolineales bacterium]